MKKLLLSGSIATLFLPVLVFAAYNDVSLDTTVVLTVNSITLNVSGSASTIESIVINPTNFVATIKSGSAFQVTAPGLESLSADTGQGQNVNTCTGSASVLGYNLSGTTDTVTVTVTPSTTLCADAVVASASSRSDAGGGGGGAPKVTAPVVTVPVVGTNAEAIAAIKTTLISLIQQLIVLLNQEIQNMQASGSY
ncbi:MAG: hypothetical protein AAB586_00350 [Patescibacteria group bacterium]